jgi:hypothetical protein
MTIIDTPNSERSTRRRTTRVMRGSARCRTFAVAIAGATLALSAAFGPSAYAATVTHPAEQRLQPPQAVPGNVPSPRTQSPKAPPPPRQPGCYLYSSNQWVSSPCLSSAAVLQQGPPPRVAVGNAPPGITFAGAQGSGATALDGSYVFDLGINDSSGSETDTSFGSNAWSLQDNTNVFAGNNGHNDWVQFVFQYFGSGTPNTCIWQIDVTVANATHNKEGYDPTGCYAMSAAPETIWGWDYHNLGLPLLGVETVTISGVTQASVYPDQFGLESGHSWNAASGGILGAGGASRAVFSPGWEEDQAVSVSDCDLYFDPVCTQGKLPSGTSEFASAVTGESSNLSTPSTPKLTWVKGHHTAFVQFTSSVPGG